MPDPMTQPNPLQADQPTTGAGEERPIRLKSGLWNGSCPECGGGHTCHEGNVLGHAVGCSLKPENIIAALHDENEANFERAERLEKALRPFALLADEVDRLRHPNESTCPLRLLAADLREARAALRERGSNE